MTIYAQALCPVFSEYDTFNMTVWSVWFNLAGMALKCFICVFFIIICFKIWIYIYKYMYVIRACKLVFYLFICFRNNSWFYFCLLVSKQWLGFLMRRSVTKRLLVWGCDKNNFFVWIITLSNMEGFSNNMPKDNCMSVES